MMRSAVGVLRGTKHLRGRRCRPGSCEVPAELACSPGNANMASSAKTLVRALRLPTHRAARRGPPKTRDRAERTHHHARIVGIDAARRRDSGFAPVRGIAASGGRDGDAEHTGGTVEFDIRRRLLRRSDNNRGTQFGRRELRADAFDRLGELGKEPPSTFATPSSVRPDRLKVKAPMGADHGPCKSPVATTAAPEDRRSSAVRSSSLSASSRSFAFAPRASTPATVARPKSSASVISSGATRVNAEGARQRLRGI